MASSHDKSKPEDRSCFQPPSREVVAGAKDSGDGNVKVEKVASSDSDSTSDEGEREMHFVDEDVPAWPPPHYGIIRRVPFESEQQAIELFVEHSQKEEPVILEGCDIIDVQRWSDLSYLERILQDKRVLVKRSPDSYFRYYDLKKNTGRFPFEVPVEETQMTLGQFLDESSQLLRKETTQRMYLQETLTGHDEMSTEFASWRWPLLLQASRKAGWGLPDSNELFVGMRDVETPLHFDERENLYFQVKGRKDICLFPWTDYACMYPFPLTHPCDRQSMVGTPMAPDLDSFPRFAEARGHTAQLKSGDLLYIPYGWWHWLRNVDHLAISVSFWSKAEPTDFSNGIPPALTPSMATRVRRNLESMLAEDNKPGLNTTMLQLRSAVLEGRSQDPTLIAVHKLLTAVGLPAPLQDRFLLEIVEGRFGPKFDWQRHVRGCGRG